MIYPRVKAVPTETGLYRIDHEPYHAGPGLSSSDLKNALISYGYYKAQKLGHRDSPAMAFGRAVHVAVLEPELFDKMYVTEIVADKRTKEGKEIFAAWEAERNGRESVSLSDLVKINVIRDAVHKHPLWPSLKGYQAEIMGTYSCPDTGLHLKCKMDLFGATIIDLKTTECARASEFRYSSNKFGYHTSAAFYQDVIQKITGEKPRFIHLVVEKSPPYGVAFYEMSEEFLAEGRKLYKAGLQVIEIGRECEARGTIPDLAYGGAIQPLQVNAAVLYKTSDYLADLERA